MKTILFQLRLIVMAIICAMLLTGCFWNNWSDSPQMNVIGRAIFGTPAELTLYSETFRHENGRWPTNYNDLLSFAQNSSVLQTNESLLTYCPSAVFTILTNGDLQVRYVIAYTNNSPTNRITISSATNQLVIPLPTNQ